MPEDVPPLVPAREAGAISPLDWRLPRGTRGRILRVKCGTNPNSSSIGSMVFALPASLLWATAAFGTASAVLSAFLIARRGADDDGREGEPGRAAGADAPEADP